MLDYELLDAKEIRQYDYGKEYGVIGQKKSNGVFFEEFEKRLQGNKAVEVFKEMATNDFIRY